MIACDDITVELVEHVQQLEVRRGQTGEHVGPPRSTLHARSTQHASLQHHA